MYFHEICCALSHLIWNNQFEPSDRREYGVCHSIAGWAQLLKEAGFTEILTARYAYSDILLTAFNASLQINVHAARACAPPYEESRIMHSLLEHNSLEPSKTSARVLIDIQWLTFQQAV